MAKVNNFNNITNEEIGALIGWGSLLNEMAQRGELTYLIGADRYEVGAEEFKKCWKEYLEWQTKNNNNWDWLGFAQGWLLEREVAYNGFIEATVFHQLMAETNLTEKECRDIAKIIIKLHWRVHDVRQTRIEIEENL